MKKVLAIALTIAMMLSLMAIMPMASDNATYLEIENADFENGMTGWSTTSTTAIVDHVGEFGSNGVKEAKGEANALSQVITIPDNLSGGAAKYMWYMDIKTVYVVYTKVTVMNADAEVIAERGYDSFDLRSWAPYDAHFDITNTVTASAGPKFIKISAWLHGNGGSFDDVRISAVPMPVAESLVPNSSFESVTDGVVDNWIFANTGEAEVLVDDAMASYEATKSIVLPGASMARADMEMPTLKPGRPYEFSVKYKQLGNDAFVTIESQSTWVKLLEKSVGEATGTTEDNLAWKTFKTIIVLGEADNQGIMLRLRNGADENPVYYDQIVLKEVANYDKDNLIINGDFFINNGDGAQDIPGWENENVPACPANTNAAGSLVCPPTTASVIQKCPVPAAHYDSVNQKNSGYTLKWDMNYNNGGFPSAWVRARFADETEYAMSIETVRAGGEITKPNQVIATLWQWNTLTLDISFITQYSTSPLVAIDVRLAGGGGGCQYDNVSLYRNGADIDIVDANGAEITGIITEEGVTFKPVIAGTITEDPDATLWLCMYEIDDEGTTRLVNAVCGQVDSELKFEGASTVAGETVVKAFVLGSDMEFIAIETLK